MSDGTTEQRIAHVVSNAMAEAGEQTDVKPPEPRARAGRDSRDRPRQRGAADRARASTIRASPSASRRSAARRSSPRALCVLFGAFIAAAIVSVTPADTVLVAKQVLVWLTLTLLVLTLVYGVVHGVAWSRRRRGAPSPVLVPHDGSRDPQLAAREERVPRHQPAAGRRELDLPAADGGARAREGGPHQRAAPVEPPRRAALRLRDLGPRARAAAVRAARRRARCRRRSRSGSGIRCSRRCSSPARGCRSRRC